MGPNGKFESKWPTSYWSDSLVPRCFLCVWSWYKCILSVIHDSSKLHVNPTYQCGDIKHFNLKSATGWFPFCQNIPQRPRKHIKYTDQELKMTGMRQNPLNYIRWNNSNLSFKSKHQKIWQSFILATSFMTFLNPFFFFFFFANYTLTISS